MPRTCPGHLEQTEELSDNLGQPLPPIMRQVLRPSTGAGAGAGRGGALHCFALLVYRVP